MLEEAAPFSGSMSSPNVTSCTVSLRDPMKLRRTANPRLTLSRTPAIRSKSNSKLLKYGTIIGPNALFSWASIEIVWHPLSLAMRSISLSNTVLPTPQSPVRSILFSERLFFIRPIRTLACSRMGSRPTSSGGGEPAPGE